MARFFSFSLFLVLGNSKGTPGNVSNFWELLNWTQGWAPISYKWSYSPPVNGRKCMALPGVITLLVIGPTTPFLTIGSKHLAPTCRFRGISADANAAQEAVGVIAVSLQVGNEP